MFAISSQDGNRMRRTLSQMVAGRHTVTASTIWYLVDETSLVDILGFANDESLTRRIQEGNP